MATPVWLGRWSLIPGFSLLLFAALSLATPGRALDGGAAGAAALQTATPVPTPGPADTTPDAVVEVLMEAFGTSAGLEPIGLRAYIQAHSSASAREDAVEAALKAREDFEEALPAGASPASVVDAIHAVLLLAELESSEGMPLFPALRAALPVITVLAVDAAAEADSLETLSRFVSLLVASDVATGSR